MVCWVYSLESPRKNFLGTQKRVRIIHGKRAIGARAIEVILDICYRRLNSAFTSPQSDQFSLFVGRNFALLARLTKTQPWNILIRLHECAGWSESSLDAHVRRYFFTNCGTYLSSVENKLWACPYYYLHVLIFLKLDGRMANRVNLEQTPHLAAHDQSLHCYRPAYPNSWGNYGKLR